MIHPKSATFVFLLLSTLWPISLFASRTPQIASYRIEVRLVPDAHKLVGREVLHWVNPTDDEIPDLWFHLYMNAFKNEESTFMRESGGRHRGFGSKEDDAEKWGYIDIQRIRRLEPEGVEEETAATETETTEDPWENLHTRITFEHPDDLNEKDQTVARIALPEPIPPRGTIDLEITFETVMPRIFARTGYEREFYMVGQWFPKIGVYLPAGHGGVPHGRWNCHQFHANTEFFADYGTYHVEITVPERFVVGATGRRIERRPAGEAGLLTYVFEQEDVHDFAWTAYPRYRVHREEFPRPKTQWRTYGDESPLSEKIEITLLYQPEHEKLVARHMKAIKGALEAFGRFVGTYPYDTITLVDPPYFALGAGGMEYPTLITCGSSFIFSLGMFEDVRITEVVLVHEFGHQYFYGLLGSNEFEEAYLDEGFNSYYEGRVMDAIYGEEASYGSMFGMPAPSFASAHISYASRPEGDPIAERAWVFSPGMYSRNTYSKTAIV
ncbi:MAG: M1 family peptidase, partial [Deltaproteobacteria bacterium]